MTVDEVTQELDKIYQHIGDLKFSEELDSAYDSLSKAMLSTGLVYTDPKEVVQLEAPAKLVVYEQVVKIKELTENILNSNLRESMKVIIVTHLINAEYYLKQELKK